MKKKNYKFSILTFFACSTVAASATIAGLSNQNSTYSDDSISVVSTETQSAESTVSRTSNPYWMADSPLKNVTPVTLGGNTSNGTSKITAYIVDGSVDYSNIPSNIYEKISSGNVSYSDFEQFYNIVKTNDLYHGQRKVDSNILEMSNLNRQETFNIKVDLVKDNDGRIERVMIKFEFKESWYKWTDLYGNYPFIFNVFIKNSIITNSEVNNICSIKYNNPIILRTYSYDRYYINHALKSQMSTIKNDLKTYFSTNKYVDYSPKYETLKFTEYGWIMDFDIVPVSMHAFSDEQKNKWNNTTFTAVFTNIQYLQYGTAPNASKPIERTDLPWDNFWKKYNSNSRIAYVNGLMNLKYNKYAVIDWDKKPTKYIEQNIANILKEVEEFFLKSNSQNFNIGYIQNSLWQDEYGWSIRLYAIPNIKCTWEDGTRTQKEFTILFTHMVFDMPSSFPIEPLFERRDEKEYFLPPGTDWYLNDAYIPNVSYLKYDKWYYLYDMEYITVCSAIHDDRQNIKNAVAKYLESRGGKNFDIYFLKDSVKLSTSGFTITLNIIPKYDHTWADKTRGQKEVILLFENIWNSPQTPAHPTKNEVVEFDWNSYYKNNRKNYCVK